MYFVVGCLGNLRYTNFSSHFSHFLGQLVSFSTKTEKIELVPTLAELKLLADPTRLRILNLLTIEELSVSEMQQVLGMGQSRVSTRLAQLREGDLVTPSRQGKTTFYCLTKQGKQLQSLIKDTSKSLPEADLDYTALDWIHTQRNNQARMYFDQLAGKFGRDYVPGRSWKSIAEALFGLIQKNLVIADLGAGEALFSQLLAPRAKQVIAVDLSEKMVEHGRNLTKELEITNLEFRVGDLECPPIAESSVDLVIFSQSLHHAKHPEKALQSAFQILQPQGRILILDLLAHQFEEARDLYGDVHLGFSQSELFRWLKEAGFAQIEVKVVDRQEESPKFSTIFATGEK